MDGINLFRGLIEPYAGYTPLEIFTEATAVFFGIWSVALARKNHIGVYPTGIVSTSLYIYITVTVGLYADGLINLYYTLMSIYGWHLWTRGNQHQVVRPITLLTSRGWTLAIISLFALFAGLYLSLTQFTDSTVPWADAATTSLAFVAMALMARRNLEHWHFWIATNTLSIPLYLYKGLGLTAFQFIIFTYLAITGLITWRKIVSSAPDQVVIDPVNAPIANGEKSALND